MLLLCLQAQSFHVYFEVHELVGATLVCFNNSKQHAVAQQVPAVGRSA